MASNTANKRRDNPVAISGQMSPLTNPATPAPPAIAMPAKFSS